MKRNRLSLFLVSMLVLTSLVGIFSMNSFAQSTDLNFTFDNNSILDTENPEYYEQDTLQEYVNFNVRNATELSQTYEATYSFTNDNEGEPPADWVVDEGGFDNPIQVIDFVGHDKSLMLNDSSGGDRISATQSFFNVSDASFEFWWAINDIADSWNIVLSVYEDSNEIMAIAINNDDLESFDIAWQDIKIDFIVSDIFFHVRFDLDDSANTFDCYVNGILEADDFDFQNHNTNGINSIEFKTSTDDTPISHVDAVGYSWDGYNATYSFTNDIDGTVPNNWIDDSGGGCTAEIINNLDNHYKILELDDVDGDSSSITNTFDEQTFGTIEFWIQISDVTNAIYLRLYDGATIGIDFRNDLDDFKYHDGTVHVIVGSVDNTWYHIKFEFECTTGAYKGLTANTFYVWINNIRYGIFAFRNSIDKITKIELRTDNSDSGYVGYIDAIGYSWDPFYKIGDNLEYYKIGSNMIPITTIENSMKEMDKFEFALEEIDDAYDVGDDDPSGWTDIEIGGGDQVNIGSYPADIDKKVVVICDSSTDTRGLFRDFSVSGEFIELNFTHEYSVLTGTGGTLFIIDSSDDSLVVYLRMLISGEIEWRDDGDVYNEIFSGLTTNEEYIFNFIISYEMEVCIFSYYIDGVYQDSYIFPLYTLGKEGLGQVDIKHQLATNDAVNYEIDNIGVYVNGISLADTEFSYLTLEVGLNWSYQENNLFWINASGYFGIYAVDYDIGTYGVPHVAGMGQPLELVRSMRAYDNELMLFNKIQDSMTEYPDGINNTFLVFYLSNWNISLNSLSIDGVLLKEGSNEYPLEFTISNCEGVFYVDNNRLYFEVIFNDIGLEYMQGDFDINNVLSENRSLRFNSKMYAEFGFFQVVYTDETGSSIELLTSGGSHNVILPQSKIIEKFTILITDNDEFHAGGASGYISNIRLMWNPSISITIVTIALIMVIIPIIIMIVPTLTLYSRYGKSVIMPVFIFMAIICFAGGLIPAWLFFILMIGAGGFLVLKKGSDV